MVVSFYLEFPLLICVTISAGHHISLWARDSGDTDMILVMCQGVAQITRGYVKNGLFSAEYKMEKYKNTLKYHWIGGEYYQSWMIHYKLRVYSNVFTG